MGQRPPVRPRVAQDRQRQRWVKKKGGGLPAGERRRPLSPRWRNGGSRSPTQREGASRSSELDVGGLLTAAASVARLVVSPFRSGNDNELDALGGVDDREVFGIVIALEMKRLVLGGVDMRHHSRNGDSF